MCGEFEEDDLLDEKLFERFIKLANQFDVFPEQQKKKSPLDLGKTEDRRQYMEDLFKAALVRSVNDAKHIPDAGDHMDAVAIQAIVFGRLAGFLAAQLPPESNIMKAAMESYLEGYSEAQSKNAVLDTDDHHHHHGNHGHHHHHSHGR